MREDYAKFAARGAEILAIGPGGPEDFRTVWASEKFPYPGVPDPKHRIAKLFEQAWRLLGLGRQPTIVVIDRDGRIRSRHDGKQMWDIPSNTEVLSLLERLA